MRHFLFQFKFEHAFSHYKCSKISPKVPKFAQRQLAWGTLKYHQNLRFWFFSKRRISICRRGTKVCAHHLDFQYINFPCAFFVKKLPLYLNFRIPSCGKWFFFLNVPLFLWVWDFVDMYLTQLGTRIWSSSIHIYSKKWFFWPPKLCCQPPA
jgi:uncharacterized membrane-anchored protein YitT (DUF2179 family)